VSLAYTVYSRALGDDGRMLGKRQLQQPGPPA
jgi:hypothetical protein